MLIKDGIQQTVDATGEALRMMRKFSGRHTDPAIIRYESLTPDDIEQMTQDKGTDAVLDYIREMEARRLQPIK